MTAVDEADSAYALGVDVGGTHTDLMLASPEGLVRSKAFTTHGNYSEGIFNALDVASEQLGATTSEILPKCRAFVNGSTIVTNVITELRGAAVGVLITRGFKDTFRQLHPDRIQYTYWDYFRNAFQNNWGWRIDHILATAPLAAQCRNVEVDVEPRKAPSASDHTVVWAEFA